MAPDQVVGLTLVAASTAAIFAGIAHTAVSTDRWAPRHLPCTECSRAMCWCRDHDDVSDLCKGTVEHGCTHDQALCVDCTSACRDCVDDLMVADMFAGVTW